MKRNLSLLALACTLALALTATVSSRAEEKAASDAKTPAPKEPMYAAGCPSPCEFSVKSHDKAEVAAVLKAHAKSHHHMDMSDKDAEGMIKTKAPKKD